MAARPSIYRQNADPPATPSLFRRHIETYPDIDSVPEVDRLTDVDTLTEPE